MNKNTFITSVDNISLKLDNAEGISLVHRSYVQRQIPTVIFTFVSWKINSSGTATVAHSIIMRDWHQSEATNVNEMWLIFSTVGDLVKWRGLGLRRWPRSHLERSLVTAWLATAASKTGLGETMPGIEPRTSRRPKRRRPRSTLAAADILSTLSCP